MDDNLPVPTPFTFEGQGVRIVDRDGETWFVFADVCRAGDIVHPGSALRRLDEGEKGLLTIPTPGGPQEVAIISESGLYHLLLTSRKPDAKRLRRWVTGEVLPQIRRTGSYRAAPAVPTAKDLIENPAFMLEMVSALNAEREKCKGQVAVLRDDLKRVGPEVEGYRRLLDASGSVTITDAAKTLGMKPRQLINYMCQTNWTYIII